MTVERWAYEGVVLTAGAGGEVTLDELKEFTGAAERLDAVIRVYEFGLRVTRMSGKYGPHLDWRD